MHDSDFTAVRISVDGVPHWVWPDGTALKVVAGGEGEGGGGTGDGGAGDGGAGTGDGGTGDGGAGEGGSGGADKTFTQADVDRVVRDRIARERTKFADYDDLKTKASKLDEADAANQSELEKERNARTTAEAARDQALASVQSMARRSAIVAEASKAGAVDPDAVAALLPPDQVTIGDDGQVTGVEDAVKALLEDKPYLVGTTSSNGEDGKTKPLPGGADGGARPTGAALTRADLSKMTPRQVADLDPKVVTDAMSRPG